MSEVMRRFSLTILIILVLALTVSTVSAHANLVRSEPAAGAVLDNAPSIVKLWFSEAPEPGLSKIELLDRGGNTIAGVGVLHGDASDNTLLTAALPTLKPGVY